LKAIILAAGRGERMRPLTDTIPKALLAAGGKLLIVRHLEKLAAAGFKEIVINHAHLGELIEAALGDGGRYGVQIVYSRESEALETAGGIAYALPLLGAEPFAVINADVFSDYDYAQLAQTVTQLAQAKLLAHLIMVDNPEHHAVGDFALHDSRVALVGGKLTFSGIAAYRTELFADIKLGAKAKLAPLLVKQIGRGMVGGEHFRGRWRDVGTPERLAALNHELATAN
jgi:N-acetyl-alpha-D-muramate 1-phosphate uridylyltransferase